jgi:hypothetical protein
MFQEKSLTCIEALRAVFWKLITQLAHANTGTHTGVQVGQERLFIDQGNIGSNQDNALFTGIFMLIIPEAEPCDI